MKIAFLHMTVGLIDRGSEISTELLAKELGVRHAVMVIASGKNKREGYQFKQVHPLASLPPVAPRNIFEKILFRLEFNSLSLHTLIFTLKSFNILKRFQPQIIVATNGGRQVSLLKLFYPQAKIVVFGRAGIGHDDLANLRANPDLFIALSEPAIEWANTHKSSHTRTAYLPNPIDLAGFQKAKKIDLHLTPPVVMVVSAFSKYKNVDKVIEACHMLGASLLLVGDGEESSNIADLLSHYRGEFRWIKHLPPNELPGYYLGADVFCFVPDFQEAFGRVYLEAMAAGLPVVATADKIRRGVIGAGGIFVEPEVESIGRGLRLALTRKRVSYSTKLKEYDLTIITNKLINLFKTICQKP